MIHWEGASQHPAYEGRVLDIRYREIRVMSDVWATGTFAVVWDGFRVQEVNCGNSEFGSVRVVVDATPEVVAAAQKWEDERAAEAALAHQRNLAAEAARQEEEEEEAALRELFTPKPGSFVIVLSERGRGVAPVGTTGIVFWTGTNSWGTHKIGFKDDAGNTHWTTEKNVEVIRPDCSRGLKPEGGWKAFLASLQAKAPHKGSTVRHRVTGQEGTVFWVRDNRLGFRVEGVEDPVWANFTEVTVL